MTRKRFSLLTRSLAAVAVVGSLALTGCASSSDAAISAGTEADPIVIGIVSSGEEYWKTFTAKAEEAGIHVELKNFSDYQLPNQGLADGDLDLNQFQHLQFLADFNVKTGNDLTPIGATAVYALDLYSTKVTDVADIPDGAEVAVPNDASNQARALLVLQDAGLVTLKDGGNSFSTAADVIADESRVAVTALKADQTPAALQDPKIYAAIVNNDYVPNLPAESQKPIYSTDASSSANDPYINIWVARAEDKDNETFAKLIEIYHDTEVTDGVIEASGGTGIIKSETPAELQEILATIEKNQKAQG
ncbi:NLPA lipoprotein [Xylanimonas cellulosilytica DSM 15894]|uniref:NLPA lipoprotein n=1 Tax=Xylanimonas cellulosilytica (strain DSM 15894 / JCM 12276 / CECT 5975 / KCTC 9989 / LMG 20990 / NBRC 107835 / XIL07) TaxID=446471 RepID=D1BUP7_XYLCX|nr:MetQ/NlpA family ABC transporter substrate-binding protein [Xylanimonas cellulosilytica]ACZ29288.1 NLPA lipoprotein [Xylanimonas cellulosilytica DSM 15894]